MRGSQQSAFANPVLVGAVTVLVALVAVFLAYNANTGLPFVPTREIKVDFANGSNVVTGNDVREGGFRIGSVSDLKAIELPNGTAGAQLTLKLNQSQGKLPVDSNFEIAPRSVLGLKYIAVYRGSSNQIIPDGGIVSLAHTSVPVQFDDINKMFDSRTRPAIQQNLVGFGDALAGRGSSLNDTIASLPQLLRHLEPVARYLSDPNTQLTRFLDALNNFMAAVAPVAQTNAKLFTDMATTFEALSRYPNDLQQTILQSPPTLDVSTDSLRAQQPFLVDLTTLGHLLTPATASLRAALPVINPALEAGIQVLPRTPQLNQELGQVLQALKDLAQAPGTNMALNALTATVDTLNPMVKYLGPFQTVCDDWDYWWTYLSEHLSERTSVGFAQRALLNFANHQKNSVGTQGATQPANGYEGTPPVPPDTPQQAEFLHGQTYGAAIDNSGFADCETGQRGYPKKLNYFGNYGGHPNLATDAHTPGNQGPTYHGRSHVPAGETFSRNPQTGPQLPFNPFNP